MMGTSRWVSQATVCEPVPCCRAIAARCVKSEMTFMDAASNTLMHWLLVHRETP
jgi:hypothetical protein